MKAVTFSKNDQVLFVLVECEYFFVLFHIKNDLLHFPPKVWESEQWIMQRENRPPFTTHRLLSTDWKGKAKSKSLHNTNSILFHRCCAILMMIAVEKLIIFEDRDWNYFQTNYVFCYCQIKLTLLSKIGSFENWSLRFPIIVCTCLCLFSLINFATFSSRIWNRKFSWRAY